jgi:hypothetical protein
MESFVITEIWGVPTKRTITHVPEGHFWRVELPSTVLSGGPASSRDQAEKDAKDETKRHLETLPDQELTGDSISPSGISYRFCASYRICDEGTFVRVTSAVLKGPLEFVAQGHISFRNAGADPAASIADVVRRGAILHINIALSAL